MLEDNQLIFENRSNMYRLLGQVYLKEITPEFFEHLKTVEYANDTSVANFDEGARELAAFFAQPGENVIEDLAVDYARVFLGAGIAKGISAYPFESIYTSPGHLIMQDAWEKVMKIYREHGLGKNEKDLPEDHLAFELQFMAHLSDRARQALIDNDKESYKKNLETSKTFLKEHLLNWVPKFVENLQQCSSSPFYRGFGKLTLGFLEIDQSMLNDISD